MLWSPALDVESIPTPPGLADEFEGLQNQEQGNYLKVNS